MACLTQLRVRDFRALKGLDLEPGPRANLFGGHNGAGKTSLLESVFLLSRGRSFRGGNPRQLVAKGAEAAAIRGAVAGAAGSHELGVGIKGGKLRASMDGRSGVPRAELARILPVLNVDAGVMDLVDQGPERRRLLLNWVTFHVEPAFHSAWSRFRRSLKQRNASLRQGGRGSTVKAWDGEFCRASEAMEEHRRAVADSLRPGFRRFAEELLGVRADWDYFRGWPRDRGLADTLRDSLQGDQKLGQTRFGPQRSDLVLRLEDVRARHFASRGQQKLLAASLMLASAELLEEAGVGRPVLLADEPLAELDEEHSARLLSAISAGKSQLFIAAVDTRPFGDGFEREEYRLKGGALV